MTSFKLTSMKQININNIKFKTIDLKKKKTLFGWWRANVLFPRKINLDK